LRYDSAEWLVGLVEETADAGRRAAAAGDVDDHGAW
jgi:hypothetical protein